MITNGRIVQDFYTPVDYFNDRTKHEAIDIVTDGRQKIYAPYSGRIRKAIDHYNESKTTGYGNQVFIQSSDEPEYEDSYSHLGIVLVKAGQFVEKGALLGYTGRTGYRDPLHIYHTHWERMYNGIRVDPLKEKPMTQEQSDFIDNLHKALEPFRMVEGTGELVYDANFGGGDREAGSTAMVTLLAALGKEAITKEERKKDKYTHVMDARDAMAKAEKALKKVKK